jgi:hypothetical protein
MRSNIAGHGELVSEYILKSDDSSKTGTKISEYTYVPSELDLEPDMAAFDPSRADFRKVLTHLGITPLFRSYKDL